MSPYVNIKLNLTQSQIDKIKQALEADSHVSIKPSHSDLKGEHVLALTKVQLNKIKRAYENGTGVVLKMSKTQLRHNAKIKGGFIATLLPMLATDGKFLLSNVLPTLATGALAGIGQAAGSKVVYKITGKGVLYVKKNGMGCKMRPAGDGLYLSPWRKGTLIGGEKLFLKRGSSYKPISGTGVLTGPNSPFKNIPMLGMIL